MSPETYGLMNYFVTKFVTGDNKKVLDVGSYDVNGTFKPLFLSHQYTGLDISVGPNVDVVTTDLYKYPFEDNTFDLIISGSTIEHVKDIFSWMKELARIAKSGGLLCVIGPCVHRPTHRHPVDCWRIYPDGMKYLMEEVAGLEVLEIKRSSLRSNWIECMGIGRKK